MIYPGPGSSVRNGEKSGVDETKIGRQSKRGGYGQNREGGNGTWRHSFDAADPPSSN